MLRAKALLSVVFATAMIPVGAHGALVISIDTDGATTGNTVAFNPRFRFGGDTTGGAGGSIAATAAGLPLGNSIFGGNGSVRDVYEYLYTPGVDADNTVYTEGQNLGNGNTATGLTGGLSGEYAVYATWPVSGNVAGDPITFDLLGPGDTVLVTRQFNQNNTGNGWFLIGNALLESGSEYVLRQSSNTAPFVSMRASGAMFEFVAAPAAVPEPGSLILTGLLGGFGVVGGWVRRRRHSV